MKTELRFQLEGKLIVIWSAEEKYFENRRSLRLNCNRNQEPYPQELRQSEGVINGDQTTGATINKLLVYCLHLVAPIEIPKNWTILCYNSLWSYFKRSANIRSLKYQSAIDHLRSKITKNRKPILSTGLLPTPTSEHDDAHSKRSWIGFQPFLCTLQLFFFYVANIQ